MPERYLQRVTWALLPFILWTFAGGPAYAALAATEQSREAQLEAARKALPRDFDDVVAELGVALKAVEAGDSDALEKTKSLRAEIEQRDVALRKEFADVEMMLRDKGMPEEILQRHRDFVAEYEKRLSSVKAGLDNVERGTVAPEGFFERAWFNTKTFFTGDPVRQEAAEELEEQLESYRPRKIQKSFKPEDLPFRRMTPENTPKPKETAEEWRKALAEPSQNTASLQKAIGAVADAFISPAQAQTSDLPGPADLAETIEVQFTPEIVALAAELNNNPVEIYNWVRNNIDFVPIWGSIQGAQGCLESLTCSAADTASLTIALLRVSGVPARYQFGTIAVPEADANAWLGGFQTLESAARFCASGGTACAIYDIGGQRTLRTEHIWVDAFVDFVPSQGAKNINGDTWISLDPTYRPMRSDRSVRLLDATGFDSDSFVTEFLSSIVTDPVTRGQTGFDIAFAAAAVTAFETQITNYFDAIQSVSTGDLILRDKGIAPELEMVPGSSPYQIVVDAGAMPSLPGELRHTVTIAVSIPGEQPQIIQELDLATIGGKTLVLDWLPESETSIDTVANILLTPAGLLTESLPARLVRAKPSIRIGGERLATGTGHFLGETLNLRIDFRSPTVSTQPIINEIQVGELHTIGLDLGAVSRSTLDRRKDRLQAWLNVVDGGAAPRLGTDLFSEDSRVPVFTSIVESWFAFVDLVARVSFADIDTRYMRYPSAGVFSSDIIPVEVFGQIWKVRSGGLVLDIDRNLFIAESRNGENEKVIAATLAQGVIASWLEGQIPIAVLEGADATDLTSATAADVLFEASRQSIPIYTATAATWGSIAARVSLPMDSRLSIEAAVSRGNTVVLPASPVLFGTRHFFGYVVADPDTGAADYIVGQEFSGGYVFSDFFGTETNWNWVGALAGFGLDIAFDPETLFFKSPSFLDSLGDGLVAQLGTAEKIKSGFTNSINVLSIVADFVWTYVANENLDTADIIALTIAMLAFIVLTFAVAQLIATLGISVGAAAAISLVTGLVINAGKDFFLSLFKKR